MKDVEILDKIIHISNSTVDIERRLSNFLEIFIREFNADEALLFTLDLDGKSLILRSYEGETSEFDEVIRLDPSDGFVGQTTKQRKPVILRIKNKDPWPDQKIFEGFKTLTSFPIMDDQHLYGLLTLLNKGDYIFPDDRLELLDTISRELAGTIRNSKLYVEAKKRIAELSVLFEVGRTTSSTIDLNSILDYVVAVSAKVIMAEGCSINVLDESTGILRAASEFGNIPNSCRFKPMVGIVESPLKPDILRCVSRQQPYVGPANKDPFCNCMREDGGDKSVLCMPLNFKGQLKGTLSLYNKVAPSPAQRQEFNQEDLDLIRTMGTMIASSLENALNFQAVEELGRHNEILVRNLRSLYQISSGMMTTIKTEELLKIIISALTHPQGLGFDRALIFLLDDNEQNLVGAAISPMAEENKVAKASALTEELTRKTALDQKQGQQKIDFKKVKIPINDQGGPLARACMTRNPVIIIDEGAGFESEAAVNFGKYPYTAFPMLAKDSVVGVFAVDKAFSDSPINPEDMGNLAMLANQAGLAIENSRLYEFIDNVNHELSQTRERLLETEKLAALGEMAAGIAHEIRNPLVSIGGFTRRILKKIEPDSPIKDYIEVIIDEVSRLEKTLHDVLTFSRDDDDHYERHFINDIIEEALYLLRRDMVEERIKVVKEYTQNLPAVYVDKRQIKHVFYNLFLNAVQAMGSGGTLKVKTGLDTSSEEPMVSCEVSDTGPGVEPEVMANIFNPFFTTKTSGVGLGLSLVHKIITRHSGHINVITRESGGAKFIVTLPLAGEGRAFLT